MPCPTVSPPTGITRRRLLGGAGLTATVPILGTGCARRDATPQTAVVTATDLTGRLLELNGPARRVVAIPIPAASMLVAVAGGPGAVVGMNAAARTAIDGSFLGHTYPELLDVPTDVAGTEFAPNVESVLALNPDLVIQWGDRGSGIIDPLRNAGMTVAALTYGTQQDLEEAILLYGKLLGRDERARKLVDGMHESLRQLRSATMATTAPAPTVLYLRGAADELQVGGGASYNNFVTQLVGAHNPAVGIDAEQATIDAEQLLDWDPHIILLGNFGPMLPETMYRDSRLSSLQAVRERQIYKVPLGGYRWDPPSQESPLMWRWLAGLVGRTGAPGLRAEVSRLYQYMYGAEPNARQLDAILHVEYNAGSADYDEFGR